MSSSYPKEPSYQVTVADQALIENDKTPRNGCAKCFMAVMSLIFVILGIAMAGLAIYTLIVFTFGGQSVLSGVPLASASVYTLLAIGLALLILSIIVWISSCNPTNVCSKIILTIFSIVMILIFLIELVIVVFTSLWVTNVSYNVSGYSPELLFNETAHELYTLCCTNTTVQTQDICSHIMGEEEAEKDCSSYSAFDSTVVEVLSESMKWVAVFFGIVAFFNLMAFICSCVLLCTRKRTAYYKPTTTYTNGGN